MEYELLNNLAEVLEERKQADPNSSYVASLHAQGEDTICQADMISDANMNLKI